MSASCPVQSSPFPLPPERVMSTVNHVFEAGPRRKQYLVRYTNATIGVQYLFLAKTTDEPRQRRNYLISLKCHFCLLMSLVLHLGHDFFHRVNVPVHEVSFWVRDTEILKGQASDKNVHPLLLVGCVTTDILCPHFSPPCVMQVVVYKKRRRKSSKTTQGHRREVTLLRVTDILS